MPPSYVSKLKHKINRTRRRLWLRGDHINNREGNDFRSTTFDDGQVSSSSELDEYGFQLVRKYPTSLLDPQDFFENNNQMVQSVYYEEISKLICDTTGANYVHCIYHDTKTSGSKKRHQKPKRKIQPYNSLPPLQEDNSSARRSSTGYVADALHSMKKDGIDVTPFQRGADGSGGGRYVCIKVWKNISPSKTTSTDYYLSSTKKDDGEYYCVSIARDDVILFKEYDSDPTKRNTTAKMGFCASFGKTTSRQLLPPPPRESIEVYCIAFFLPNSKEEKNVE